jgi:hypothetical protein
MSVVLSGCRIDRMSRKRDASMLWQGGNTMARFQAIKPPEKAKPRLVVSPAGARYVFDHA